MDIVKMYEANYTEKQVAEEIYRLLNRQGKIAINKMTGACEYIGKDNKENVVKCAVGLVIPNSIVSSLVGMSYGVSELPSFFDDISFGEEYNKTKVSDLAVKTSTAIDHYGDLLERFQAFHDFSKYMEYKDVEEEAGIEEGNTVYDTPFYELIPREKMVKLWKKLHKSYMTEVKPKRMEIKGQEWR